LVLAEHFAGGDAEKQAVTDLAGCTRDCYADWGFGHGKTPKKNNGLKIGQKKTERESSAETACPDWANQRGMIRAKNRECQSYTVAGIIILCYIYDAYFCVDRPVKMCCNPKP
jgi:hypothetical protein